MNAATLIAVMIETPEAVKNIEEIVSVPGIDVALIGSSDLTAELGIPGEFEHPQIVDAYKRSLRHAASMASIPGWAASITNRSWKNTSGWELASSSLETIFRSCMQELKVGRVS